MTDAQMNEIQRTLGELLANQRNFLSMLEKHIEEDRDLARRITRIESRASYAMGMIMACGVAVSFIVNAILKKIGLA